MYWTDPFSGDESLIPETREGKLVLELLGPRGAWFFGGKHARAELLGIPGKVGFRKVYFDLSKVRAALPNRVVVPGELSLLIKERGGFRSHWVFRGNPDDLVRLLNAGE